MSKSCAVKERNLLVHGGTEVMYKYLTVTSSSQPHIIPCSTTFDQSTLGYRVSVVGQCMSQCPPNNYVSVTVFTTYMYVRVI